MPSLWWPRATGPRVIKPSYQPHDPGRNQHKCEPKRTLTDDITSPPPGSKPDMMAPSPRTVGSHTPFVMLTSLEMSHTTKIPPACHKNPHNRFTFFPTGSVGRNRRRPPPCRRPQRVTPTQVGGSPMCGRFDLPHHKASQNRGE